MDHHHRKRKATSMIMAEESVARHHKRAKIMDEVPVSMMLDASPCPPPSLRIEIPRLSRKRAVTNPSRAMVTAASKEDCRFIPNRSRMDPSRAQDWLLQARRQQQSSSSPSSAIAAAIGSSSSSTANNTSTTTTTTTTTTAKNLVRDIQSHSCQSHSHYERQLRQVLFGSSEVETTPILAFGAHNNKPSNNKRARMTPTQLFLQEQNPYRQDVLRPAAMNNCSAFSEQLPKLLQRRPPRISMDCITALDAPNLWVSSEHNHELLGQGREFLAVALGGKVYLWKTGSVELLVKQADGHWFSCVQWSPDGTQLALGTHESVLIFEPQISKREPICELLLSSEEQKGHVLAMAWNGVELAVAYAKDILRYNLQDPKHPAVLTTYTATTTNNSTEENSIISLQWRGNILVSATSSGGIHVWDSSQKGCIMAPQRTLYHSGIQSLEIHPRQHNILVSAGKGGLKFWNLVFGKLRAEIPLDGSSSTTATRTVCSTVRDEILVAHNHSLTLWSLGPKVQKLMEHVTNIGKITGMVRGPLRKNGQDCVVCSHDDETLTFHVFCREVSKEKARALVSLLEMPTLR